MARNSILHRRRPVAPQAIQDTDVLSDPRQERVIGAGEGDAAAAWPGGIEPTGTTVSWAPHRARVSIWATLGLIVSVVGLCATLTGLLAPEGFALGLVGFVMSLGGIGAAGRPGVTGRGLAGLGMLCGLAAVVLAVLALTGDFSWPDSKVNEISRWHTWLVAHWSWLGRW
jgi:hypothetical protein